jgi:acyl-CoA synthetase (NDP forming)
MDGLRELAATGKPVAVLKAGRSEAGQRAAASHTGALASTDRVLDAALRQLGIVRVDDIDELLDVGEAFAASMPQMPSVPGQNGRDLASVAWKRGLGPRVAVVTTSGGSGILAADAIEAYGLQLARLSDGTRSALDEIVPAYGATANPVDVTASVMSDPALFDRALQVIVDDDAVDLVIACFCVLTGSDVDTVVTALGKAAQRSGLPVLVARTGAEHLAPEATAALRAQGIPA